MVLPFICPFNTAQHSKRCAADIITDDVSAAERLCDDGVSVERMSEGGIVCVYSQQLREEVEKWWV